MKFLIFGLILVELFFLINAGGPSESTCTDYVSQFNLAYGSLSATIQDICDKTIKAITDLDPSSSADVFEADAHEIGSSSIKEIYTQFNKVFEEIAEFIPGATTHDIFIYFITGVASDFPLNCFAGFQNIFIDLVNDCYVRVNSYITDLVETHPL